MESFPEAVSLIEWAETLREWGAAPEQRLALYFRCLPSVSACCGRSAMLPQNSVQTLASSLLCLSVALLCCVCHAMLCMLCPAAAEPWG